MPFDIFDNSMPSCNQTAGQSIQRIEALRNGVFAIAIPERPVSKTATFNSTPL
ncbi:MAG: hypothetical protein SFU87_17050 [Chitinophagaceae bacterium]|nr:hypothetical protein [Chitinophagaceae bacterium]